MNVTMVLFLLVTGFAVPFLVLDVSRVAGGRHWPVADDQMAGNFRPFAVFLALFAGPALLAQALLRMRLSGGARTGEGAIGAVIACGWACCYGFVVLQFAGLVGLPAP